jgi:hypothetical protein
MSLDDARSYATRGRGPRRRPSRGWESHLSNIFVKLGVTNRTELTAVASRRT